MFFVTRGRFSTHCAASVWPLNVIPEPDDHAVQKGVLSSGGRGWGRRESKFDCPFSP